jgi:predicted ATPase
MFFTDYERMTDSQLTFEVVRLTMLHEQLGRAEFKRLADRAEEVRMLRMLTQPNPYEVPRDERVGCRAASVGG